MIETRRKRKYTATPSRLEVNSRAIPILPQGGWKLWNLKDYPIIGAAPKNYLSYGDPSNPRVRAYIAKKGRTTNGDARECVTEEIISKIGAMLPLEIAKSRLVRLSKTDVRFMSEDFVVRGRDQLLHGIDLLALYFETDRSDVEIAFNLKDKNSENRLYTINNIILILEYLFPENFRYLKKEFFKMVAFDAFVGAPDRHGMNWGVLAPLPPAELTPVHFAPIFDTARGLFREMSDDDMRRREERDGRWRFLERYAERSSPIFGTDPSGKHDHFTLVKWIVDNVRDGAGDAIREVFDAVDVRSIEHMLQRNFRRVVTQYRIGLIKDLLSLRIQRLREEIQP